MRRTALSCIAVAATLAAAAPAEAAPSCSGTHWLGAWSASPAFAQDRVLEDTTLRLVVNPTTGGRVVRVHLSNRFGEAPLRIGAATIARRASGAALVRGTVRRLRFGGRARATLAAGADAVSDPVRLRVRAFRDLAVSIHVERVKGGVTFHPFAFQTSYEGAGSHASDRGGAAFTTTTRAWPLLSGIDVRAPRRAGAVVVFGASSVDGTGSPTDANHRFTDYLARRLARRRGPRLSVLNQGIAGNRLLVDGNSSFGPSLAHRARKDVLLQPGVTDAIVWLGSGNDFRIPPAATAEEVIRGFRALVTRLERHGLNVILATTSPSAGSVFPTAEGVDVLNARVRAVNRWIRSTRLPDASVDLWKVLGDPARPDFLAERYDSGDGQHPNSAGYRAVAGAIRLSQLGGPCG